MSETVKPVTSATIARLRTKLGGAERKLNQLLKDAVTLIPNNDIGALNISPPEALNTSSDRVRSPQHRITSDASNNSVWSSGEGNRRVSAAEHLNISQASVDHLPPPSGAFKPFYLMDTLTETETAYNDYHKLSEEIIDALDDSPLQEKFVGRAGHFGDNWTKIRRAFEDRIWDLCKQDALPLPPGDPARWRRYNEGVTPPDGFIPEQDPNISPVPSRVSHLNCSTPIPNASAPDQDVFLFPGDTGFIPPTTLAETNVESTIPLSLDVDQPATSSLTTSERPTVTYTGFRLNHTNSSSTKSASGSTQTVVQSRGLEVTTSINEGLPPVSGIASQANITVQTLTTSVLNTQATAVGDLGTLASTSTIQVPSSTTQSDATVTAAQTTAAPQPTRPTVPPVILLDISL